MHPVVFSRAEQPVSSTHTTLPSRTLSSHILLARLEQDATVLYVAGSGCVQLCGNKVQSPAHTKQHRPLQKCHLGPQTCLQRVRALCHPLPPHKKVVETCAACIAQRGGGGERMGGGRPSGVQGIRQRRPSPTITHHHPPTTIPCTLDVQLLFPALFLILPVFKLLAPADLGWVCERRVCAMCTICVCSVCASLCSFYVYNLCVCLCCCMPTHSTACSALHTSIPLG